MDSYLDRDKTNEKKESVIGAIRRKQVNDNDSYKVEKKRTTEIEQ